MASLTHTQVVIVGAGPNGLACASALSGLGVQVMIVDALSHIKNGARAALVHPRTLEVLDTVGLAGPLLELGIHSKGVIFHSERNRLLEVDITLLRNHTRFPTTLLLPQHEIERVFQEYLETSGVKVLRGRKIIDMKEERSKRWLELTLEDGSILATRYVVGADGSRSMIRSLAGIDFRDPHTGVSYDCEGDPTAVLQMVFSDVYLEEPLPHAIPRDAVSWHLNKHLLLCPLPSPISTHKDSGEASTSYWRFGMIVPADAPSPPRHPDIQYLQKQMDVRNPWKTKVTVSSVVTSATYRLRSAVAGTFYKKIGGGNVLLVGDAAHVHSPSGGQGMNLGLCDAVALAHAIQSHIEKNSGKRLVHVDDSPLIIYSASRRTIAIKVVGMVKNLTAVILASSGWQGIVRNTFLWIVGHLPIFKTIAAWRLSGLIYRDA